MNDVRPAIMPKAREDRLIVKELPDETLVYDLNTDQAHCLNQTAAVVWKNCDGEKSIAEINHSLAEQTGAPVDETMVWLALEQLEKFKLLDQSHSQSSAFYKMNRRQLVRTLSVAAVALPVVVSIVAPLPAHAVSCPTKTPTGGACSGNGNCCSGTCCGPGVPGCPNNTCL